MRLRLLVRLGTSLVVTIAGLAVTANSEAGAAVAPTVLIQPGQSLIYGGGYYEINNQVQSPYPADGSQTIDFTAPTQIAVAWNESGSGFGFPYIGWGTQPDQYSGGLRAPGMGFPTGSNVQLTVHHSWSLQAATKCCVHSLIDLWAFKKSTEWSSSNREIEIVPWTNNPNDFQERMWKSAGVFTADGITWNVFTWRHDTVFANSGPQRQSVDLDVMPFVHRAIALGRLSPTWFLSEINTGFEVWGAGSSGSLTVTSYSVTGPY
jgi:hypothetical protein